MISLIAYKLPWRRFKPKMSSTSRLSIRKTFCCRAAGESVMTSNSQRIAPWILPSPSVYSSRFETARRLLRARVSMGLTRPR